MWSLPNILTLSRIVLLPLLIWLLWWPEWQGGFAAAFALYVLLAVTDYVDGVLARARGVASKLGAFLDPIADKIMVAGVLLMLVAHDFIFGVHVIAAILILMREILVSGLREFLGGLPQSVALPVSKLAKWKTMVQMVALGALILAGALPDVPAVLTLGLAALWGAALLTTITGWDYLRVGLRHMDT
ncbi:CDP-diacylglycerol--glycerol-3-phosphate 3-phosphatidyltransferase [Sphingosinithalassobacter sp. CS137]|uniref:CDP-diacylglycerol--glycerol-3-phosphate 3-phosphatidyltransferase n=1 Tax=Sphingosinithalassobacter sp. CS137 TaxID=2762748 RepID=UPI00165DDD87|nr:CDP-diacylglycerol--glycerol-3-phosphate 3-phosphatidyltransferase [Sphingosinithalassobacter sp. CS137]